MQAHDSSRPGIRWPSPPHPNQHGFIQAGSPRVPLKFPRNHHSLDPFEPSRPMTMVRRKQIAGVAMRNRLQALVITAALIGMAAFQVRAAEPSAVGLWEQVAESSGKAESWFKITERNGVYEGAIVKIFFKPGEDENWTCDKCEGAERNAPV